MAEQERKRKTWIAFHQAMKTKQDSLQRIEYLTKPPCLLPFHGWLFSVSSSAIDVGEHELETMGWGEPTSKLTHTLNSWTVKPLHWIRLWWGTDRTPSRRLSCEPYLFLSEMCALSWSHAVPDRPPCLSLQTLGTLHLVSHSHTTIYRLNRNGLN